MSQKGDKMESQKHIQLISKKVEKWRKGGENKWGK